MKIVSRIVLAYPICAASTSSTQASDDRVGQILSKVSLEDKIDYIRRNRASACRQVKNIGRRVVQSRSSLRAKSNWQEPLQKDPSLIVCGQGCIPIHR
jgi:hypothetical protein